MNLTDSNALHWIRIQADACRRMWAAVVLSAYRDWWSEAAEAAQDRIGVMTIEGTKGGEVDA